MGVQRHNNPKNAIRLVRAAARNNAKVEMGLSENRVYPNLWPFMGYENWGSVGTIFSNTPRSTLWKLFACLCQGIHKYILHSFIYLSHRRHRLEELLSALMTSTCLGMESSDACDLMVKRGHSWKKTRGPPVFNPSLAGTLFHGFLRAFEPAWYLDAHSRLESE